MRPPKLGDLAGTDQYRQELFWEYAGMDDESYRAMYLEEARKVVEQVKNGGTVTMPEEEQ
jgi:hypothetical protein